MELRRLGQAATLVIAASGASTPLAAGEDPMQCGYDWGTGRTVPMSAFRQGMFLARISEVGDGVAGWSVYREPQGTSIYGVPYKGFVMVCATGQVTTVTMPGGQAGFAADERFHRMVYSRARFTLSALEQAMVKAGARVRHSRQDVGSCPCDVLAGSR